MNFLPLTRIVCLPGLCDVTFVVLVHFVVGVSLYFDWDAGAWCFSECLSGSLRGDVLRVDLVSQPIPLQHLYFMLHFWLAHTCLCDVTITNVFKDLCEEVMWWICGLLAKSFSLCSWLILVQVPFIFICVCFLSPPTHTSFHHHSHILIHTYFTSHTYLHFRRQHLRHFRLGLTRVLLNFSWVRFISIPIWSQWPGFFRDFQTPVSRTPSTGTLIQRISCDMRRFQWNFEMEAASQTSTPNPSLEEKGPSPACLWLSSLSNWHLQWLLWQQNVHH